MAVKTYVVTEEGLEWAQAFLDDRSVEKDKSYELNLEDSQQETALVAAGWLIPQKGK